MAGKQGKPPRWADDPPPGFMADGTFLGSAPGEPVKNAPVKIDMGDGRLVSPEDYEDEESAPDLDEMQKIADEVAGE